MLALKDLNTNGFFLSEKKINIIYTGIMRKSSSQDASQTQDTHIPLPRNQQRQEQPSHRQGGNDKQVDKISLGWEPRSLIIKLLIVCQSWYFCAVSHPATS